MRPLEIISGSDMRPHDSEIPICAHARLPAGPICAHAILLDSDLGPCKIINIFKQASVIYRKFLMA